MVDSYWKEITIGFVIAIIISGLFIFFYKPEKISQGFSEEYCISLLAQHSLDAKSAKLETIRSGSMLFKDGVIGEENNTIRVFLQANKYEGILEYCRLSSFSTKSLVTQSDLSLQCKLGDLKASYGRTNEYFYIFQQIRLSGEDRSKFIKEVFNSTDLEELSQETIDKKLGQGDFYQSSITYVNPSLSDIYSTHIDAFIDTAKILNCSGQLPNDLIEQSKYKVEILAK